MTTLATATTKVIEAVLKTFKTVAPAGVLAATLELSPVPASRPRVSKWGVYYSPTYKKWKASAEKLTAALDDNYFEGPIMLIIEQVCPRPKTTARAYPRGDFDNHAKGPADALTVGEKVWKDDDQVVACLVVKRFAEPDELPRTDLWWCRVED